MAEAWIFVFWGQSNNRSAGTTGYDVPARYQTADPGVLIWNTFTQAIQVYQARHNSDTVTSGADFPQKWGPEAEFARRHRVEHPGRPVYLLKYAVGGTSLGSTPASDWLPSEVGELFAATKTQLDALKAALTAQGNTPVVKAIVGMQGESDTTTSALANAYQANKTAFYAAARTQWGNASTRFVDGRISNSPILTYKEAVRQAQLLAAAAEGNALLVDTDNLTLLSDEVHYVSGAIPSLGRYFYDAYTIINPTTVLLVFLQEAAVSSSNRFQVTTVVETTLGTTPTTPRMRTRRLTGEGLFGRPTFEEPNELRSDRMTGDETQVGIETGGTISWELHYPYPNGPLDVDFESAFYNPWVETPSRDNDGTADSVITGIVATTQVVTVAAGATFGALTLVRFTGFTAAANNGVFKVTTGSATVPAFVGGTLVDEAAPPATARMKTVGVLAGSGDITATATGLTGTGVNFLNLPIIVGQWIKIGGTAVGERFATAALNARVRITAIASGALTLDHLPAGWTTDAGTGKTIKLWFFDQVKNGTTQTGQSIEKGFLGQTTPTYLLHKGMVTQQLTLNFEAKRKITGTSTYAGMSTAAPSTTSQDASPDAPLALATYPVFASSANVGQVWEAGSPLTLPNPVRALTININNNVTMVDAVDSLGPVDITGHECQVTGTMNTYFGDKYLLDKFFGGTPTSIALRARKGTQELIITVPRAIYNGDGSPQASGKNTDMMANFNFRASKDESITNAMICCDRAEYVEE